MQLARALPAVSQYGARSHTPGISRRTRPAATVEPGLERCSGQPKEHRRDGAHADCPCDGDDRTRDRRPGRPVRDDGLRLPTVQRARFAYCNGRCLFFSPNLQKDFQWPCGDSAAREGACTRPLRRGQSDRACDALRHPRRRDPKLAKPAGVVSRVGGLRHQNGRRCKSAAKMNPNLDHSNVLSCWEELRPRTRLHATTDESTTNGTRELCRRGSAAAWRTAVRNAHASCMLM